MSENNLYYPPEIWYNKKEPIVFLAGPIQGADNWQSKAIELLHKSNPELNIANPRREVWDNQDNMQVTWETNHLRLASAYGGILFWLAKEIEHIPERAFAQTSRFEFGEWFTHYKYRKLYQPENKLKIALGIDDEFPGRDYILERVFEDCPELMIATTLEETCQLMLDTIGKK